MNSRLIDSMAKVVGKEAVLYTPEDLAVYSYDGTFAEGQPDLVVLPGTTEQVSQVVALGSTDTPPTDTSRNGFRIGSRLNPNPGGRDCPLP